MKFIELSHPVLFVLTAGYYRMIVISVTTIFDNQYLFVTNGK